MIDLMAACLRCLQYRHRLFREHCDFKFGIYLKNLARLGRDLKRTMLVDNSPQVFAYQVQSNCLCVCVGERVSV